MALSIGFRVSVSLHPAIQATGRLALAPAGLAPASRTCLSLDTRSPDPLAAASTAGSSGRAPYTPPNGLLPRRPKGGGRREAEAAPHGGQGLADQRTAKRGTPGGSRVECPGRQENGAEGSRESRPREGRYKANQPFTLLERASVRPTKGERVRYYLGVDWADQTHAVWVVDERGTKVAMRTVPHTAEGLSEWGRELDEWRAQGTELWAAIERPEGRVVDFLLDHAVVVYRVNPKALDRARDRFRQRAATSGPFEGRDRARTREGWRRLRRRPRPGPPDGVRGKGCMMQSLRAQLTLGVEVVGTYREAIEDFFAQIPAARWIRTLPIGDHAITAPTLSA